MTLDARVSRLEGAYEQVDRRLTALTSAMESLRTDMNTRFDQMDRRFNNLYVIIGGSWVTIMGAIVAMAIAG